MAEELRINVVADDNASKTLDSISKKTDKLEGKDVEIEVNANVKGVVSALDKVAAEAKQSAEAAEVLGRALGPELAAKADTQAIVADLQKMGLTLDEIKVNADELGGKLKQLSDDNVGGGLGKSLGTARGEIEHLGKSAESSKSVLANMVGNSAQDLGQLTGVAGSAGVAIGQMAEYMADAKASGEGFGSVLKNFAVTAVPIAALGIGVQLISNELARQAKIKAWDADQVKMYADAVNSADGAVKSLIESLTKSGKIEGATVVDEIGNLNHLLAQGKLHVTDWVGAVEDGDQGMADFAKSVKASGLSLDDQTKLITAAAIAARDYKQGVNDAADSAEVFSTVVTDTDREQARFAGTMGESVSAVALMTDAYVANSTAAADLKPVIDQLTESAQRQLDTAKNLAAFYEAQSAAMEGLSGSQSALLHSQDAFNDQQKQLKDNLKATKGDATKTAIVYDSMAGSAEDLANKTADVWEQQAKANGIILTHQQRLDIFNKSLAESAKITSGPARKAILDRIFLLNQIPPEKQTDIIAAVDEGELQKANELIADASKDRDLTITATAITTEAEAEVNKLLAKKRTLEIAVAFTVRGKRVSSIPGLNVPDGGGDGTFAAPAPETVGINALAGPTVTPMATDGTTFTGPTLTIPVTSGKASVINNIIVNVPRGYRELDAAQAAARIAKRSGRLYAPTA